MAVVLYSIAFSLAQIGLLLGLVRILGSDAYGTFSINISIAVALSALTSEWLRLIVARYSSIRGYRLRGNLLRTALIWVLGLSALSIAAGFAGYIIASNRAILASSFLSVGLLTGAGIIGECTATFLRFNVDEVHYLRFAGLRVLLSGTIMLTAGSISGTAAGAGIGFATGTFLISGASILQNWWWLPGRADHRRLLRFLPAGVAMATSSITTSAALSLTRLVLRTDLTGSQSGALFLALDLATRGMTVLGSAFNTWSAKNLFDATYGQKAEVLVVRARKAAQLFALMWASFCTGGTMLAFLVPVVVVGPNAFGDLSWIVVVNLAAIILLMARVYNLDLLLSAMRHYRALAIVTCITVIFIPLGWIMPVLAPWALLSGTLLSCIIATALTWQVPVFRVVSLQIIVVAAAGFVHLFFLNLSLRSPDFLDIGAWLSFALAYATVFWIVAMRWLQPRG